MKNVLIKGNRIEYYPIGHMELLRAGTVFSVTHNRVNIREDNFKPNDWSISIHKSNLDKYVFNGI